MDEELLNLFLGATQGNKNVSSTLGNLDSPLLLYLAGQYNPLASMGAGGVGTIGSRYAGNEDYPAVNEILNEIATGADQFQVATKAKSLVAKGQVDGFDSAEFEKLANQLYKESRGGSEGKSWMEQPALSDPTELYTSENVPLPDVAGERMAPLQAAMPDVLKRLVSAQNREKSKAFDSDMSEYNFLANTDEGRALAKSEGINLSQVDPGSGDIYSWRGTKRPDWNKASTKLNPLSLLNALGAEGYRTAEKLWDSATGGADYTRPKRSVFDPRNVSDAVYGQLFKRGKKDEKSSVKANPRISDAMERKAMASRLAQSERLMAEMDAESLDKEAQAYRQGVANYKAKQGRTPLDDQLAGVMRLLSQNR